MRSNAAAPEPTGNEKPDDNFHDLLLIVSPGDVLVEEGTEDSRMYLIEHGTVELVKSIGPSERIIATLEAGDFFGELSALENGARHLVSARAASAVGVLPLDAAALEFIAQERPDLTMRLLHRLASRLREHEEQSVRARDIAAGVLAAEKQPLPEAQEVLGTLDSLDPSGRESARSSSIEAAALVHVSSNKRFELVLDRQMLIGRFDPATQKAPDIDLQSIDPASSLSRRHATVWCHSGNLFLREEPGVTNGTVVEGRRLRPGEARRLGHGQSLRIGLVDLVVEIEQSRTRP